MGSCILIGAGDFGGLLEPIQRDDYVIAVDGGLNHAKRLGIIPNTILGDFDSLGFVPDGSTAFPIEKDDTDMMLAVKHGLRECHERFIIYGGMDGRRLDHTVANFQIGLPGVPWSARIFDRTGLYCHRIGLRNLDFSANHAGRFFLL